MLLTPAYIRAQLDTTRARLALMQAQLGSHAPPESTTLVWCQSHPDGPDGVVDQSEHLAWQAENPDRVACLALWVQAPTPAVMIGITAQDGVSREEVFDGPDADGRAVARYLELVGEVLATDGREALHVIVGDVADMLDRLDVPLTDDELAATMANIFPTGRPADGSV